jgi:hypothetical protein
LGFIVDPDFFNDLEFWEIQKSIKRWCTTILLLTPEQIENHSPFPPKPFFMALAEDSLNRGHGKMLLNLRYVHYDNMRARYTCQFKEREIHGLSIAPFWKCGYQFH